MCANPRIFLGATSRPGHTVPTIHLIQKCLGDESTKTPTFLSTLCPHYWSISAPVSPGPATFPGMKHLSITVKVWLSIGIFVLGSIVTTALGQFQGRNEERILRRTSDALFPAVQRAQQAEAAFRRSIRGFNQALILQSAPEFEQAVEEGRTAVTNLQAIAAIPGLPSFRSRQAMQLAERVQRFLMDAVRDLRESPRQFHQHRAPDPGAYARISATDHRPLSGVKPGNS